MEIDQKVIDLWWHYEEIAMHFNQLIIQYRLQLMGGAGAIGALASYFIGSHVQKAERRHVIRAYVATVIFVLLLAAAILDVCYYNELLLGAVDALKSFEGQHPEIYMSTRIDSRFANRGISVIFSVYGLILIPLALFTIWSWCVFLQERNGVAKGKRKTKNGPART
jgi:uncharacterized membrane protein YfcA